MEHRYSKRFPTDIKTLIFKNGMPVAIGRICNFSSSGIFVKTEFDLVGVNQSLEIEMIARSSSRVSASREYHGERRLYKTFVMHKSGGGVGLLLRDDCAETQKNFSAFIADEMARGQLALDSLLAATATPLFTHTMPFTPTIPFTPTMPSANETNSLH